MMRDLTRKAQLSFGVVAMMIIFAVAMTPRVFGSTPGQAGNALISLEPSSLVMRQGDSFDVSVKIHAGVSPVNTAQVFLDFDPLFLEVVDQSGAPATSLVPGSIFSDGTWKQVLLNEVDNAAGRIGFAGGKGLPGGGATDATTDFILATARFRAVAATPDTRLTFDVETVNTRLRTKVLLGGEELLGTISGATLKIDSSGIVSTAVPTPTPVPSGSSGGGTGGARVQPTATPAVAATPPPAPRADLTPPPAPVSQGATPVPIAGVASAGSSEATSASAATTATPVAMPDAPTATATPPARPTAAPEATPRIPSPPAQPAVPGEGGGSGNGLMFGIIGVTALLILATVGAALLRRGRLNRTA